MPSRWLISIAVAAATVMACSSTPAASPPNALEVDTGVSWNVVVDPRFGTISFAEPRTLADGPTLLVGGRSPSEAALVFLESHAAAFSLRAPRAELALEAEGRSALGLAYAAFTPNGDATTRLSVHFDAAGRLAFVAGRYGKTPTRTSSPLVTRAHPCFLDGSGKGAHFYAAPPLRALSDEKHFEVSPSANGYVMQTSAASCTDANAMLVTSPKLDSWDTDGDDRGAAVDAYYHVGKALEFYRTVLARASYDDKNGPLAISVHGEPGVGAAYSLGWISVGRPPIDRASPALSYAAAFDAIAHEVQHGVTASTLRFGDAPSDDDSNAAILDEAVSDMFGAFAEHWLMPGPGNLTIGEAAAAPGYPATRDLAHPTRCLNLGCVDDCDHRACPDHLSKLDCLADVHRGTGVASNAWALMTVGGSNDTSGISVRRPLGWDVSLKLWYGWVVSRAAPPIARFEDVALTTVALARHASLDPEPVACSWVATGVIDAATARQFWNVDCP